MASFPRRLGDTARRQIRFVFSRFDWAVVILDDFQITSRRRRSLDLASDALERAGGPDIVEGAPEVSAENHLDVLGGIAAAQ